jgi:hypothetical protein
MLPMLNVHSTRISDMVVRITSSPAQPFQSGPIATALVIGAIGSWHRQGEHP